jgi:predicted lipoprotein
MPFRIRMGLAVVAALFVPPTHGGLAAPPAFDSLAETVLARHIQPRHARFAEAADALKTAATGFCAGPDAKRLDAVREAFAAAMDGWQGVQHIAFGPIQQFNHSFRIQFWPDSRNTTGRQLSAMLAERPTGIFEPHGFTFASVAVQGLPVVERLIHGDAAAKLLAGGEDAAYRCRLLVAVAGNVAGIARRLDTAWSDKGEAAAHARAEPQEAVSSLLTGIDGQLLAMRDRKLLAPLGKSADRSRPRLAESWRSGLSLPNVVANLTALQGLYRDVFAPLLAKSDAAFAELLNRAFDATLDSARDISAPLKDAVGDPAQRKKVEILAERLRALRQLAARDTAQHLGLVLGFNSQDGD